MKKNIIITIFFTSIIISFCYGYISRHYEIFPSKIIRSVYYLISKKSSPISNVHWRDRRTANRVVDKKKLISLPYLRGHETKYKEENVTINDKEKAFDGLNLYISAHNSEAVLMDMEGQIFHNWRKNITSIWPEFDSNQSIWRRVHLFENGDLIAIYEDQGLIKIDKNSNLIWAKKGRYHHDIFVTDNGNIYVLYRKKRHIQRLNESSPILEDFIIILNSAGDKIKSISLLEILKKSPYSFLIFPVDGVEASEIDLFHTNTIEVFNGKLSYKSPIFNRDNILVSFCTLNLIAIIDTKTEEVVWAYGPNNIIRQHQPTLLENGNILVFDNGLTFSRVLELYPLNNGIRWDYSGDNGYEIFSKTSGSCQRLPNGNTLITESDSGRALEVTKDKEIVWEFINPHRLGRRNELIATLYEVIRIPYNYLSDSIKEEIMKN